MTIALMVMTDGRDECLADSVSSLRLQVSGINDGSFIHDDSGDEAHRLMLRRRYPDFEVIGSGPRRGFGGAYRYAWQFMREHTSDFWFVTEDDFVLRRRVDLFDLAAVLDAHPYLVQLALRRQPWNADEVAAGGIVEQHPDAYTEVEWDGHRWLEHRLFFTTNPSLYRRSLLERGWPTGPHSEGVFTHRILADPAARFGFWGGRDSGVAVTHIGHQRVGTGY